LSRYVGVIFSVLLISSGIALAAGGPSTNTRTLNIKGTAQLASNSDVDLSNGACNFSSWVDQCSNTSCSCFQISPSTVSGSMDKGKQTVTEMFVTIDENVDPVTEPTVGSGPNGRCGVLAGVLVDASNSETKTINFVGTDCKKVIAINQKNPGGTNIGDVMTGGWGISDIAAPNPVASGWGTWTGSIKKSNSSVSFKFTGLVTE
jgi:hypothetical protein